MRIHVTVLHRPPSTYQDKQAWTPLSPYVTSSVHYSLAKLEGRPLVLVNTIGTVDSLTELIDAPWSHALSPYMRAHYMTS